MDELYVVARRVLLDALEAIGTHRDAVVLVGAQAVYLRVGEADLAVAPYTTDGDLAIDPSILAEVPPLEQALQGAGFQLKSKNSVGMWVTHRPTSFSERTEVGVDLLVPASVSPGRGRRAARLPGHDALAARKVHGLDGSIVDADEMTLAALEGDDTRTFQIRVAGPAALLVAKTHKISERYGTRRQSDKDALDILRLLRGTTTDELATRCQRLRADTRSREVTESGLVLFRDQFSHRSGVGVEMVVRAVGPLEDVDEITLSCEILANDLLGRLDG